MSVVGIGITLLNYSKDGDFKIGSNYSKFANKKITSKYDALKKLKELNFHLITEVTWNTTLFVSLASSFMFFSVSPLIESKKINEKILGWCLSVFFIFGLQDLIIRWKNAHRKNKIFFETQEIIDRLIQEE